jgi:hypothetical protein
MEKMTELILRIDEIKMPGLRRYLWDMGILSMPADDFYRSTKVIRQVMIESSTRKGKFHIVTVGDDDIVKACSCEGFTYQKSCKHIRIVQGTITEAKLNGKETS